MAMLGTQPLPDKLSISDLFERFTGNHEFYAFINAIVENPIDEAPRRIINDWLMDQKYEPPVELMDALLKVPIVNFDDLLGASKCRRNCPNQVVFILKTNGVIRLAFIKTISIDPINLDTFPDRGSIRITEYPEISMDVELTTFGAPLVI